MNYAKTDLPINEFIDRRVRFLIVSGISGLALPQAVASGSCLRQLSLGSRHGFFQSDGQLVGAGGAFEAAGVALQKVNNSLSVLTFH